MAIDKIPKVGKIYKTVTAAYNALKKGFTSQTKREPNPIEEEMIMEEAKKKITSQGENISTLDTGIMSQAPSNKGVTFIDDPKARAKNEIDKQRVKKEATEKYGIKSERVDEIMNTPFEELEDFTIRDEDVVQNLVDQKFGKGYFDNVDDLPTKPDLDRPFVTKDEMSAFTLEDNARKLNKAKGMIDELGAKTTRQKLFVADLVEDVGEGIYENVDMGAVVRSNMYDDLIEQGIDEDVLTKVMYSGTKSDDFGTTMAKIKSNAQDEGVDINETLDFYDRTFSQVSKPKKANGGRIGYSEGNDDPKKLIKKIPKVGKTISGLESLKGAIGKIMNRFGEDAITTADRAPQPEKTTQQAISEFEARNRPDTIKIESREILDVPPVPSGFKISKEKLMAKFPEIDEEFVDQMMDMDKDTAGRIIKMLENRRLDPEAYDRLLEQYGDTLEFQGKFDEVIRRSKNASGGLPHILGV